MSANKVTNCETRWWDNGTSIDVPPGEPVMLVTARDIPRKFEPDHLRRCVELYAFRGRICVLIKIRDWYAIIDESMLSDEYCVVQLEPNVTLLVAEPAPRKKLLKLF